MDGSFGRTLTGTQQAGVGGGGGGRRGKGGGHMTMSRDPRSTLTLGVLVRHKLRTNLL